MSHLGFGAGPLSDLYCGRCGFPVYLADRFCGRCDLPVPPAAPGARPPALIPGPHEPQRKCWNCPATMRPDRSFCTHCGAGLADVAVSVPRPRKSARQFRNPQLGVSLFILAVQIPLLGLLYWAYTLDRSIPNLIFVAGIAATAAANVVTAIALTVVSLRRKINRPESPSRRSSSRPVP